MAKTVPGAAASKYKPAKRTKSAPSKKGNRPRSKTGR
jgi:hypothetical protein